MELSPPKVASVEAQSAVLGCLMLAGDKLAGEIFQRVSAEDFGSGAHRRLFESALDAFKADEPVDAVTMVNRAGAAYEPLARSILDLTVTTANWEFQCGLLHEAGRLRRLQELAIGAANAETADEAAELLLQAQDSLTDRSAQQVVDFNRGYITFLSGMDPRNKPEYEDFGLKAINEQVRVRPGSYIVIGAGTSVGKSALAAQFALAAARKKKVGFFSFEMSDREIMERMGAQLSRVEFSRVQGRAGEDEIRRAARAARDFGNIQLEIINASGFDSGQIRALTLARKYEYIVVDYIQLISERGSGRVEQVTKATMGLQQIAKGLGVTVLALSQFSRPEKAAKGKAPSLADLRESGQIEQDADVIMLLWRMNEDDHNGPRWLSVAKNRGGPLGNVCLSFEPKYMEFIPCDPRKYIAVKQVGEARRPKRAQEQRAPVKFVELPEQMEVPF